MDQRSPQLRFQDPIADNEVEFLQVGGLSLNAHDVTTLSAARVLRLLKHVRREFGLLLQCEVDETLSESLFLFVVTASSSSLEANQGKDTGW